MNRRAAAEILLSLGTDASIPTLIDALDDESPYVRMEAHEALEQLTGRSAGYNKHRFS